MNCFSVETGSPLFQHILSFVYLFVRQMPFTGKVQKSYAVVKMVKPARLVQNNRGLEALLYNAKLV